MKNKIETNKLYCGDNLEIMKGMPAESVDLIYADPPFFTQRDWGAFDDRFDNMDHYIGWISERISEMRRLLKPAGSMYLHCDAHASHYIKVAMDGIFGVKNFNSDIVWERCGSKGNAKMYSNSTDNILFYSKKKPGTTFNKQYIPYKPQTLAMFKYTDDVGEFTTGVAGKIESAYKSSDVTAPKTYQSVSYDSPMNYTSDQTDISITSGNFYDLGYGEKCPKNGYRWTEETMRQKIADGLIIIKPGLVPQQKRYLADCKGVPMDNIWTDIENNKNPTYPTEKPEALLERIINASSNMGDIVLDPFNGGGTTVAVAKRLGRNYIGIDDNPNAIKLTDDRLAKIASYERLNKWI